MISIGEPMKCSTGHICHLTERAALDALRWAKRQPGGKGLRWLNVFLCRVCGYWHVGRSQRTQRERLAAEPKPAPAPKPLTTGQLRRKAEREAERAAHDRLYADWQDTLMHVRRMVDAEIARLEAMGLPKRNPIQPEPTAGNA